MKALLDRPTLDVAGAFGTDPVVDSIALGSGREASMSANVTMSTGFRFVDAAVAAKGLLAGLATDASITDLLAARRTALSA